MSLLSIRGLTRRYGSVNAVAGVDLELAAGSRAAVVGPSGCGKTTLLRLIAGFEAPTSGTIVMDGRALADGQTACAAHTRGIGIVSQDGSLFPHLTIADNIGFGIPKREIGRSERITALAYTVGLDAGVLKRRPHQLSGGQQQRVALARAMALKPRLMLLDEPFSALDTGLRANMRKTVSDVLGEAGITTILVTHDQTEALCFADQLVVMQEGRFVQVGPPRDLYFRPVNAMVAHFLGDAIVMPARVADGFADSPIGRVPVATSAKPDGARILLRPEQIEIDVLPRDSKPALDGRDGVYGVVTDVEFAGPTCTVILRVINTPGTPLAAIGNAPLTLRRPSTDLLAKDAMVRIRPVGAVHVIA